MASQHRSPFSAIDPGLSFSPLRGCGIAPSRPVGKRTTSSRWRYEDKNWWVEEGKATVFARSVSASAINTLPSGPVIRPGNHQQASAYPTIARDSLAGLNKRCGNDDRHAKQDLSAYTPEQIAGYKLYSVKAKRLSSHEYGFNGISGATVSTVPPVSPPSPLRVRPRGQVPKGPRPPPAPSPSPRIVELEGSPPLPSPSRFQTSAPIAANLHATPTQNARNGNRSNAMPSHAASPQAMTVIRKPVGSGASPKAKKTSTAARTWAANGPSTRDSAPQMSSQRQQEPVSMGQTPIHRHVRSYDEAYKLHRQQRHTNMHAHAEPPNWAKHPLENIPRFEHHNQSGHGFASARASPSPSPSGRSGLTDTGSTGSAGLNAYADRLGSGSPTKSAGNGKLKRPKPPVRFRSDLAPELAGPLGGDSAVEEIGRGNGDENGSPSRGGEASIGAVDLGREGLRVGMGRKRNAEPKSPTREREPLVSVRLGNNSRRQQDDRSNSTSATSSGPVLSLPAIALDLGIPFPDLSTLLHWPIEINPESYETIYDWVIYTLKLVFVLYLASCLWGILAAVKDAVTKALEPVIAVYRLLRWIIAGRGVSN